MSIVQFFLSKKSLRPTAVQCTYCSNLQVGRQGVEGAAFTCEETVLVSLGGSLTHQSVSVWDWRQAPDSPLASFPLKAGKLYTHLAGLLDYIFKLYPIV